MSALNYNKNDNINGYICSAISFIGMCTTKLLTAAGVTMSSLMMLIGILDKNKNCAIASAAIGSFTALNYYFLSKIPTACYNTSKKLLDFNYLLQFRDSYLFIDMKDVIKFSDVFNEKFKDKKDLKEARITKYAGIAFITTPIVASAITAVANGKIDAKHSILSTLGISFGAVSGYMLISNSNSVFRHRKFFELKELLPEQRKDNLKKKIKMPV